MSKKLIKPSPVVAAQAARIEGLSRYTSQRKASESASSERCMSGRKNGVSEVILWQFANLEPNACTTKNLGETTRKMRSINVRGKKNERCLIVNRLLRI